MVLSITYALTTLTPSGYIVSRLPLLPGTPCSRTARLLNLISHLLMSKIPRIALLICGALTPNTEATYGDYEAVYTLWLRKSLPPGADFSLDTFDVIDGKYPDDEELDQYSAIMLTGSASSAYDDIPWINKLVDFVARVGKEKPRVKLIGICFGHQIFGRAFGGKVIFNGGAWEVGLTKIQLSELGKELFGVDSVTLQQMHRDHVSIMPSGFRLLGSTEISENQGMVRFYEANDPEDRRPANIQIFAVQGHPEFVQGIITGICETRVGKGAMSAEVAQDAERRKDWPNDGIPILGKVVWNIIGL